MTDRRLLPVPGPPRGRRRPVTGELRQRVQSMRAAEEAAGSAGWPLLRFSRDVILLVVDLLQDPRVSRWDKVVVALAVGYLAWPGDLVPDMIPVVGLVDDLSVVAIALRRLLSNAGYEVIYQLWRGGDEGLALVLTLGGVQE